MNLFTIFRQFPDQEACIAHLEELRWSDEPHCPLCGSFNVARKNEGDRVGRWNCHECNSSFNVLSGTIMQKTRIPLQQWFMAIGLMINAKKSLSAYQLARDVELTPQTARYVQRRIRAAMAAEEAPLLQGLVEADETYVGGKPRKKNKATDREPAKRGRGTDKTPIIGAVERGGKVVARVATDLSGKGILRFLQGSVDAAGTLLITDEYRAYAAAARGHFQHAIINHAMAYADGETHTNTIEGFWALVKRAWYGSHHHYSYHWTPLFVAEASWKYNHRKDENAFSSFLRRVFR